MQGHELRRFREVHGLTTQQLADMVRVPVARVESWESRPSAKQYSQIGPEARKVILRELTLLRDRRLQEEAPAPRALPDRFVASALVPLTMASP
jgi:transcriptional regulator with XRE-family HTH domain